MDSMNNENQNHSLFQQIGSIQGTLTALNSNISDFKTELRSLTSDQNRRIDELRKEIAADIEKINSAYILLEQKKLDKAEAEKANLNFVTKDDFAPIKKLVYGCVGTVLLAFMGMLLVVFSGN